MAVGISGMFVSPMNCKGAEFFVAVRKDDLHDPIGVDMPGFCKLVVEVQSFVDPLMRALSMRTLLALL